MQREKRERLLLAQVFVPDNVTFGAIDFESESLRDALRRYGADGTQPTFFSWLGVTMYLTEKAVLDVLRVVAGFASGSEITFTFAPSATGNTPADDAMARFAELAASQGEPWRTYFDPDELVSQLRTLGFSRAELLDLEEAAAKYFAGRNDGLPPPRRRSIVSAIV
jgi:methyltransferase (TIGR00027 family)